MIEQRGNIRSVCQECGKEFWYYAQPGKRTGTYCSKLCYFADARRKNTVTCTHCGRTFVAKKSRRLRANDIFCSFQCRIKCHKGEKSPLATGSFTRECATCGRQFERKPSKAGPYCSKACAGKARRKDKPNGKNGIRGTSEYTTWRTSVLSRDDHQCVLCGSAVDIEVHHLLPIRDFPELACDPANGVTLCRKHHRSCATRGREYTFIEELSDGSVFSAAYGARWDD